MSDTPRTDAHMEHREDFERCDPEFARQLEREASAATLKHVTFCMEAEQREVKSWQDIAELNQRLIERTAAYEAKDAAQVRRIAELESNLRDMDIVLSGYNI